MALAAALGLVGFVRVQAVSLDGLEGLASRRAANTGADPAAVLAELESSATFQTADGRRFRYTHGDDSYLWLRLARTYLDTGSTCDAVVDGQCRDTYANAPVGRVETFGSSLHVPALALVHRVLSWLDPGRPLMASAPWLSILLGVLGVIPAFAIGRRLAGDLAGFVAGTLAMVHPDLLWRSAGADNDAWNVVLPLFAAWMVVEASLAASLRRALLFLIAAALVVEFHAEVWDGWVFGFAVLVVGLGAYAALTLSIWLAATWRGDRQRSSRLRRAAGRACFLVVGLTLATFVSVGVLDSWETALGGPRSLISVVSDKVFALPADAPIADVFLPSALATVAELQAPAIFDTAMVGGPVLFFFAWLGVLFLLLPPDRLETWHLGLLVAANLLFRQLWGHDALTPITFALLLFGPMAAALAVLAWMDRDSDEYLSAPIVLMIVWFLFAAVVSREHLRFRMLLAPPFALAIGVFFGRLSLWTRTLGGPWLFGVLAREPSSGRGKPAALAARERLRASVATAVTAVQALIFVAAAAAMAAPLRLGVEVLRDELTPLSSRWVAVLERLRDRTAPGTIVNSLWDFGYWIEYFGDRPTTSDGGSLRTLSPYWTARALLAPSDAETAGLLRMLNCGSAATDGPEAERSARNRLVRAGMHPSYAPYFLTLLASRTREDAAALLAGESIVGDSARDVLDATHCHAPPSVLLLSSRMVASSRWLKLGAWDFRRAYVAYAATRMEPGQALDALTKNLRYGAEQARSLLTEAPALRPEAVSNDFLGDPGAYVRPEWTACTAPGQGSDFSCPLAGSSAGGRRIESIEYSAAEGGSIGDVRVWLAGPGGKREASRPDLVLVADGTRLRTAEGGPVPALGQGPSRDLAVLIDSPGRRVLAGTSAILGSGLTRLFFLDEVYSPSFRKIDDRGGAGTERLVLWQRID